MKKIEDVTIKISNYYLPLIQYALVKRIQNVENEFAILKISKERDLTRQERWLLPANLQGMSQEELITQIDPWHSLVLDYQFLLKEIE